MIKTAQRAEVQTLPKTRTGITGLDEITGGGRYELEIVDISQHPTLAEGEQIIAAPTLIKKLPLPLRRFIGDMSHTEKILLGLDLREKGTTPQ